MSSSDRDGRDDTDIAASATLAADDPPSASRSPSALTIVERSHYEILGEFGRGGLGRVLRARDRRIGRVVAVKEVLHHSPALLARFAREAVVTANLQHPAIVPVYEVGCWPSGEPFYAMKLVAGRSLADAVRAGRTLRDRLPLLAHVTAVADALAYAHGERVIHRDLKPANVLVGDFGETVVIDWGLAKHLGDPAVADLRDEAASPALPAPREPAGAGSASPTAPLALETDPLLGHETVVGSVLGTPGYMAPEQARGEAADERVDVYAIGAMLYETLARVRPYAESNDAREVLARTTAAPPRPLAEIEPEIPRELVAIVERAMAFDPADRYRTAKALADDLKRFATGQLVGAQQYTAWMLIRRWLRRHRALVAIAATAIVAIAVIAAVSVAGIRRARDRALAAQATAEDRAGALAEEQGRQLEVGGDAARALPYLADAVARGRRSPALGFEVARALDHIAGVEAVLAGSTGPVNSVSYSADGGHVVAAGADLQIRVWDTHTHALARVIGTGGLASWSPDGRYIATLDLDQQLALRDPSTGAPIATVAGSRTDAAVTLEISPDSAVVAYGTREGELIWYRVADRDRVVVKAHAEGVRRIAFSRDGRRIATASHDHTATVWDLATHARLATIQLADAARAVAFAPDGASIVVASTDGTLRRWDIATGAALRDFVGHTDSVESVRFDATGAHVLSTSSDHTISLWDAATGARLVAFDAGGAVLEATYSPDGSMIAARTDRGTIALLTAAGAPLELFSGHVGAIGELAWSPDGAHLASAGLDGDVRLWSTHTARAVAELDTAGSVAWRGAWSPDGTRIAIACKDGAVRLFDGQTGALRRVLTPSQGHGGDATFVAFSPDGARLASASADGTAMIWDPATGAKVGTIAADAGRVRWVGYSPDGSRLATTHDDGTARLWDATTLQPAGVLHGRGNARRALWSADGARLLVPQDGHGATLWDARTATQLAELAMESSMTTAAAWSPSGDEIVLGSETMELRHFDGHTGAALGLMTSHTLGPIMQAAFAPDGSDVATAGGDGLARRWRRGAQIDAIGDATDPLHAVAYRPDGALLATAYVDADIWDAHTGQLVGALPGPHAITDGAIAELHWSPDGTRLLLLSLSQPPRLWHVAAWTGDVDALRRRMACALRLALDGARLVRATPDAASCAAPNTPTAARVQPP